MDDYYQHRPHANVYQPIVVEVRRACPNQGQMCLCTGECKKPITAEEKLSALRVAIEKETPDE